MAYYPSFNPASETIGSVHPDPSESEVDLTLRLGSSDDIDKNPPYFSYFLNPGPMKSPEHANAANFTGTEPQAVNPFDFIYGKGSTTQGGQSHDTNYNPWSSETRNNFLNSNGLDRAASGGTFYSNYYNIPPAPQMNEYILLNPPSRRGGRSSGGLFSGPRGTRRQTEVNYHDPNKRCTNYNCGTNNTPMWRKGPLGPKSLCNACGIKYRKEEEKRKVRLEAGSSGMGNQDKH